MMVTVMTTVMMMMMIDRFSRICFRQLKSHI